MHQAVLWLQKLARNCKVIENFVPSKSNCGLSILIVNALVVVYARSTFWIKCDITCSIEEVVPLIAW